MRKVIFIKPLIAAFIFLLLTVNGYSQKVIQNPIVDNNCFDETSAMPITSVITGLGNYNITLVTFQYVTTLFDPWISLDSKTFLTSDKSTEKLQILDWGIITEDEDNIFSSLSFDEQHSIKRRTPYNLFMVFPAIPKNSTLLNIQESTKNGFFWKGIHISSESSAYIDTLSQMGDNNQIASFLQKQVLLRNHDDIEGLLKAGKKDGMPNHYIEIGYEFLKTQKLDSAEVYLTNGLELIEKQYGKYSNDYCDNYHLLIEVYNLSYNYEKLIDSYLNYLDIIEKVYGKDIPKYSQSLTILGNLYIQLSKYELSEKYLMQALELQEKYLGKDHPDYILTYNNLGLLYFHVSDYENARAIWMDMKGILENKENIDRLYYAEILTSIGIIDLYTGNFEQSEKFILDAKQALENSNNVNSLVYINTLIRLGELNILKNNYSESEKFLISAKDMYIHLCGNIKDTNYANIIADLATVNNSTGNYEKAEQHFIEALQVFKEATGTESAWYATTLSNQGLMYFYTGNYQKAEEIFIETKNIQEKILGKNHPDYARTIGNLGTLYTNTENFQLAEKYLLKSKEIYEESNSLAPQFSMVLNNIGGLYYKMGDRGTAFDYFLNSAEIVSNLTGKTSPDYALTLLNLSEILNQWGNDTLAINLAKTATVIFYENFGEKHPYYILALNNIGSIRNNQGIYDKAEAALLLSDSLFIKVFGSNHPDRILSLNNLSYLYAKQEKYDLALKYILEANNLSEKSFGDKYRLITLENLCSIYWLSKKYDMSLKYLFEWNHELIRKIGSNFSFMSTKQRKNFWNNNNGYSMEQLAKNLLYNYSTDEIKSFTYNNTLFSKGLLLRSSNEIHNAILNSGNQELITKFTDLQALRQQIIALQSKTDSTLVAYTYTLETKADSLDKIITVASSEYRDLKADLASSWQDVRKQLKTNEVAIEFIDYKNINNELSDSIFYAALILRKDSQSPEYVPLFEQSQLSELLGDENPDITKRIQKLYNGGNSRLFNGQKLYDLIWKPLEKYLDGIETVYYSPSGLLHRISFSALPVDTLCLMDKYNLHLVSSTREIVYRDKKQTALLPLKQVVEYGGIQYDIQDTTRFISYAEKYKKTQTEMFASRSLPNDSTRSAGWKYLPGTEAEVNDLAALLQRSKVPSIKYMGAEANEESFKNLSGNSPELLHIATHGFFLEDEKQIRETGFMRMMNNDNRVYRNPLLRSGLLFAGANRAWKNEDVIEGIEDGVLTAEEIANLNLSGTRLVVLSACETGLGEVNNSEGVFGLQRAFKLAGVETLVMSLWKVDDAITSQFMLTFYQNLLTGKSKLESFKIAQKQIREQNKNPYYWAGFVMMD